MTGSPSRAISTAAAAVAAGLLFAGCGSNSAKTTTQSTPAPVDAPGTRSAAPPGSAASSDSNVVSAAATTDATAAASADTAQTDSQEPPASSGANSSADPATSPAGPQAGGNACSLVTEKEAGTALGADPGRGKETTHLGASACVYGQLPLPGLVTVNVVPTVGKAGFEQARGMMRGGKLEDIQGLGDGAFATLIGPSASIEFYRGDTLVVVGLVFTSPSPTVKDQALTLAKAALGRL